MPLKVRKKIENRELTLLKQKEQHENVFLSGGYMRQQCINNLNYATTKQ